MAFALPCGAMATFSPLNPGRPPLTRRQPCTASRGRSATLAPVGIPAWAWFVIAVLAALAGAALLLRERSRQGSNNRERHRWAALRGWQHIDADDQLLEHWAGGAIAYYPDGVARDVVIGSTFTSNGRRPVYVADSVHEGSTDFVLTAVRCRRRLDAYLELWLPSVPFQRDQMPDLLGPVGQRYAFVSDVDVTRSLITADLADAAEQIGSDINVVWLEGYWVVAAAPPNSSSARLERLLRDLGELADLVDPFDDEQPAAHQRPIPSQNAAQDQPTGAAVGQQPQQPQQSQQDPPTQQQPQGQQRTAQSAQAAAQAARTTQVPPATSPYDEPTQRAELAKAPEPRADDTEQQTPPAKDTDGDTELSDAAGPVDEPKKQNGEP